jgi:hypothetical protein
MNAKQNMKFIEQQLSSISMSERVRSAALHEACIAGMFVEAIEWVGSRLQRSGAQVFAKPSPKY